MFKIQNSLTKKFVLDKLLSNNFIKPNIRTFLSAAYYCEREWEHRLNSPVLQKVNLDELYYDIDQKYQKTRQISAIDVDIFTNATTDGSFIDENLDLVHKLRLSADTMNTLNSTGHALIRIINKFGNKNDLLTALDDRLNYGLFLDFYTANILLDTYWKSKDFTSGARVASQLMLQEEFNHAISNSLSLLHCYNYLVQPGKWPEYPKPEEPEEEVKIRVKYLRNPYDDDHFDLRDPNKIVGKTLAMFTKGKNDSLNKSLHILGLSLYKKESAFNKAVDECLRDNTSLYKDVLNLVPEDSKEYASKLKTEEINVQELLINNVKQAEQEVSQTDIAEQCKSYARWEEERVNALEEQKKRILTAKRIENIEQLRAGLKEKETRLWFFENEEEIERAIEAKRVFYPKRWFGKKKKPKKVDESYVPPEIQTNRNIS